MKKSFGFIKFIINILSTISLILFLLIILRDQGIRFQSIASLIGINNDIDNYQEEDIIINLGLNKPKNEEKTDNDIIFDINFNAEVLKNEELEKHEEYENKEDDEKYDRFLLYDQLPEKSQYIYNAIYNNYDEILNGKSNIDLGNYLSDLITDDNKELQDVFQSAITAFIYDNPESFVLDTSNMTLYIEQSGAGSFQRINMKIQPSIGDNFFSELFPSSGKARSAISAVRAIRDKIVSSKTGDVYDDAKIVHDYLVDTCQYDENVTSSNPYDIYGALINHTCVCDGYAKAFSYIMEEMGYYVVRVVGTGTNNTGTESHAWNLVKNGNKFYGVDCTWDDPIIVGNGTITANERYKFFMRDDTSFINSHTPKGRFSEHGMEFSFPSL